MHVDRVRTRQRASQKGLGLLCGVMCLCTVSGFAADGPPQQQGGPGPAAVDQTHPLQPSKANDGEKETARSVHIHSAPSPLRADEKTYENKVGLPLLKNLMLDQRAIWTSPARLRFKDAYWLVPLGGLTGGLLATDTDAMRNLSSSPRRLDRSRKISDYGAASLVGAAGGMYLWGRMTHNEHKRETGLLSGEAILNSFAVTGITKYVAGRQRPLENNALGRFRHNGTSFPSEHATAAWSVASVIAHEYPGPLTKVLVYGLASAVSFSRVTGKQHFPSDVLVGSAIGWFVGRHVYRTHHNPDLGGAVWDTSSSAGEEESERQTDSVGSTYVPLDSWVYPSLERLSELGYVTTAITGMKPWTRSECARLTEEAGDALTEAVREDRPPEEFAVRTHVALEREFAYELGVLAGGRNRTIRLESVYTRLTSLSGAPLTDGYHFGQTISYDFGRPFRRGANAVTGSAFSASAGPFALYVRGEFQHAPAAPRTSESVLDLVASLDLKPRPPAGPFEPINRWTLLDTYLAYNLKNWQLSVGKQSLSWGPGAGGSLILSNNSEPLYMFRLNRVAPFTLPSFFRRLGQFRVDQFVARPRGYTFTPRPWIFAQKVSTRLSSYFEIGYARTFTLGGKGGDPLTTGNFLKTFLGLKGSSAPGSPGLPGDSRDSMDWTLRIPGLRNYLVLYNEMYADDDTNGYENPPRAAFHPGLHLTRVPGLAKLDFRIEAASTEVPGFVGRPGFLNYWNGGYRDGWTNNGVLMGNTVGRSGRVIQLWSNYTFSPKHSLQFSFKNSSVDAAYIPGGGSWQDYSVRHEIYTRTGIYVRSLFQFEHIGRYPALFSGKTNNVTASFEVGFSPEWHWK